MRSKHAEKTRVGLWGQSIILKAFWGVINGIRARPLPVRCGSGTNQAEVGGHVTPEAEEGGEWLHVTPKCEGVVVAARGMTMRHS